MYGQPLINYVIEHYCGSISCIIKNWLTLWLAEHWENFFINEQSPQWYHYNHINTPVADAGFLEGGFCYIIAKRVRIFEATPLPG